MKKLLSFGVFLLVAALIVGLAGCDPDGKDKKDSSSSPYDGFYNYPTGRVSSSGRLAITNTIGTNVLLFYGGASEENYIGTVGPFGTVNVSLPEQQFYTIVAVEKATYETRLWQAAQFNTFAYYSNSQSYTISVTPTSTWGGGNWTFDNNTNYWVQVKKADLTENYAVIQPNAKRVTIPAKLDESYDYVLQFSREVKYNGQIVAMVDFTDTSQSNSFTLNSESPSRTTTINNSSAPNTSIKPAVMVINNGPYGVRVFRSNTQVTNGAPSGDMVVNDGARQLMTKFFEVGDITTAINFRALAWEFPRYVPAGENKVMAANKVYEITIPTSGEASGITVAEVDGSGYYD